MKNYQWLIRREFWENKAIWIMPAVLGALLVLTSLFGTVTGDIHVAGNGAASGIPLLLSGKVLLLSVSSIFFMLMSIYSTWYLLDSLYADRKDRSVLFWKSLPITDTEVVLSKLLTALVVIPMVYWVAANLTALLVAFIVAVRAGAAIGSTLWHLDLWLQIEILWIYVIITAAIWYLPVAAWLMLVSAWAKRAVLLWSALPLIAVLLVERWLFGSQIIAHLLLSRTFSGFLPAIFASRGDPTDTLVNSPGPIWSVMDLAGFVSSPAAWIGVLVGIALLYGAIQMRLRRIE